MDAGAGAIALRVALARSSAIVAFTGAGISTESGVPDFRSAGSPWLVNKPIDYAAFMASAQLRREAWRRKFVMDDLYAGAQPSRGHRALVALRRQNRLLAVITQNIDNLHQMSGLDDDCIIELHGNGSFALCTVCSRRHELREVRAQFDARPEAPVCECGGPVKSATVSFGQPMPAAAMRRAGEAARACDLFLVLGSSLVVYPAATFPQVARDGGARLIVINRDPTPLDGLADLVIHGDIGDTLEAAGL